MNYWKGTRWALPWQGFAKEEKPGTVKLYNISKRGLPLTGHTFQLGRGERKLRWGKYIILNYRYYILGHVSTNRGEKAGSKKERKSRLHLVSRQDQRLRSKWSFREARARTVPLIGVRGGWAIWLAITAHDVKNDLICRETKKGSKDKDSDQETTPNSKGKGGLKKLLRKYI